MRARGFTLPETFQEVFVPLMSKMPSERISVESSHAIALEEIVRNGVRQTPDVAAIASRDEKQLAIMIWHYHDDDIAGPDASVELVIDGLGAELSTAQLTHFRIDSFHSNAYDAWRRWGSPKSPSALQYAELEKASQLTALNPAVQVSVDNGRINQSFTLPRQGISLIVVEYR